MTTHSSILAWRIPWTESLQATVHRVTKSQTQLKQLSMHKMPKHSVIKINNILMQYMFNKIFCKKKSVMNKMSPLYTLASSLILLTP